MHVCDIKRMVESFTLTDPIISFNKIKKKFKYKGLINQNEGIEIPVYENFQLNCDLREKFFVSALKTNFLEVNSPFPFVFLYQSVLHDYIKYCPARN